MNIWHSLGGMYRIRIVSASISDMISAAVNKNIRLYDLSVVDELQVDCSILRKDFRKLTLVLAQKGADVQLLSKQGVFWPVKRMLSRPVLLLGLLFILFLDLYIPTRIFFVAVEGNSVVPVGAIMEVAEKYGIRFGAARKDVRSEKIKNALLGAISHLQWAGVNTRGCVATISVQEGNTENIEQPSSASSSIVADFDGVIEQMTVTEGTPLCKVGQAVKKGQLLVSGYTDLGLLVRLTNAEAEIIANTQRQIDAVYPTRHTQRTKISHSQTRYYIILGKNIIKLYNDSGISDTTCVKMYDKIQLTLPGGFQLPLSLMKETQIYYDHQSLQQTDPGSFSWLEDYIQRYLKDQMVAGDIKLSDYTADFRDGIYHLNGKFLCTEAIGKKRSEEIR